MYCIWLILRLSETEICNEKNGFGKLTIGQTSDRN